MRRTGLCVYYADAPHQAVIMQLDGEFALHCWPLNGHVMRLEIKGDLENLTLDVINFSLHYG